MKRIMVLLIMVVLVTSCNLKSDKNETLCTGKWIIFAWDKSNYESGKLNSKMETYQKSDEKLVLKFEKDGFVTITRNKGEEKINTTWWWKDDEKKELEINWDDYIGYFNVVEIDKKELKLYTITNLQPMHTELLWFKNSEFE